jgi:hypothetical protein
MSDVPGGEGDERRHHLDDLLDEALDETFPSSDAVQLSARPEGSAAERDSVETGPSPTRVVSTVSELTGSQSAL